MPARTSRRLGGRRDVTEDVAAQPFHGSAANSAALGRTVWIRRGRVRVPLFCTASRTRTTSGSSLGRPSRLAAPSAASAP